MGHASKWGCFVFLAILVLVKIVSSTELNKGKICIGTNGRMSVPSNRDHHYRNLRERYLNCTYVDGNLELTWLQDENLDLSFLQYIREVTGYVLISHVHVKRVVFPSLQIIRGRVLFKLPVEDDSFALLVILSKMHTLEMPALRDVLQGSVSLFSNYNLCHIRSINWIEIMSDKSANYSYTYNFSQPQLSCHCHESCERGCWGEGPENCQKFSKITCSPQCHDGRCYGPGPRDCCHLFCAGGCTGPTQSECLACRNFYDEGECKQECPAMQKYNTITYSWDVNPNGKYAYGATCVRECPGHLLKDKGACVRSCPEDKKAVMGDCVPCNGPCPKACQGVDNIHSGNIDTFRGCTIIEGSLVILDHSFDGFQDVYTNFTFGPKYPEMHPSQLKIFSTLKEVTGYISIQASHPDFKNLSFLHNLEIIGGRETTEYFSSLYIVKTSLESLNLRSLKLIRSGSVYILENQKLCYAENIKWRKLIKGEDEKKSQLLLENNRKQDLCEVDGLVCHKECSDDGCWGIGEDQCLSCRHFKLGDKCVNNCNGIGIYQKNLKECSFCHSECEGGCMGPESNDCKRCKNVKDGPYCIKKCPLSKFDDNRVCTPCHANCIDECRGPENNVGSNGCLSCHKALVNSTQEIEYCLRSGEACPLGHFAELVVLQETGILKPMAGKTICRKCHPSCRNCNAYGIHTSVCECKKYRRGERCEESCTEGHYADEKRHECRKCSNECSSGCFGPTEGDCLACRNYRIYLEGEAGANNTRFNCTAQCPPEYPYKVFPEDISDPYCARDPHQLPFDDESIPAILGGTLGCVFLLCIVLLIFCYYGWQTNKKKEAALKMTMTMMPYDDNEPLKPTNIKPNLAKLRIVKEAELRKGGILGYGAFGTVYKGVWVPEGENVKIPVAIKVLREGTGTNVNKEILEEAYIMASVDHPNLLQLLAVCMTTQIMLVTQLMPLGCLLDYVRNNKDKIGSKPLLNWCTQIARGMHYLEERRLVHRDLAARNVLVQTPNCVKITDFGLAKLLDYNEEEYKAAGGKMPIKWLALECIQHRIFTHKSDVWAFGVTIWEILSYGGRPYDQIPARDVPDLLEKGERLPQPSICTIDVYMLLIRCWTLDAESRPSFRELSDEFAKMSRDPGRFLVIHGDKLMRLPSYTPQDERELIQSLSSAIEGDGVVMAAEEYLHPKHGGQPIPTTSSTSVSEPATPVKVSLPFNPTFSAAEYVSGRSESPQNRQNLQREKKYAHLEAAQANSPSQRPREDSLNTRYCSDPLKMLDSEMGDDECFEANPSGSSNFSDGRSSHSGPGYGWVGDLRLDLPLDEDDYLMPSPQPSGVATVGPSHQHYMELVPSENGRNRRRDRLGKHAKMNGNCHPANHPLGMDNPEYHMMNNPHLYRARGYNYPPHQPLGVPVLHPNRFPSNSTSSTSSINSGGGNYNIQIPNHNSITNHHPVQVVQHPQLQTQQPRPFQPNMQNPANHILPNEVPHEYYNDMPRIPSPPRSETTV